MLATSHKVVIVFFATLTLVPVIAVLGWLLSLFFQQDYRPWEESMWDLAETRQDAQVVADNYQLSAGAPATYGNRNACESLAMVLEDEKSFSVKAQTYCKIRVRTDCPCGGRHWYERDDRNWLKVHLTRGPQKGANAWVCGSAVGPTVTPL